MTTLAEITRSLDDIGAADSLESLDALRVALLGKNGAITAALKSLGALPPDERKARGAEVNRAKDEIADAIAVRKATLEKAALDRRLASERIDITLPGQSGIDLLKQLRRDRPELAILVLSMHPERSFAVRLMRAGANGYVPKMIVPEELVKAVRAVGTGRRYITPIVAELLASDCASDEEGPMHNRLSERELQVFTRIARGISPAVMANELGLSVKTVSTYRARILEKMGMRSNAEIAAYAVRNSLVD